MITKSTLSVILLVVCGCAGVDSTESSEDVHAEGNVVHKLTLADAEVLFHWLGAEDPSNSDWNIAIEVRSHSIDYVAALEKEHGLLTSLEVFQAFAPEDLAPHHALVEAHELEAAAIGRSAADLAVKAVDGSTLVVDKAIATCSDATLSNISPYQWQETQVTDVSVQDLYIYTCAGSPKLSGLTNSPGQTPNCERFPTTSLLRVGECRNKECVSTDLASCFITLTEFWWKINYPAGSVSADATPSGDWENMSFTIQPTVSGETRGLAVIGRNNQGLFSRSHRQVTGVGVIP